MSTGKILKWVTGAMEVFLGIPFVGMIMHILTAVFLLTSAAKEHDKVSI